MTAALTPIFDEMLTDLVAFPAARLAGAAKGARIQWMGVGVTVSRMASDGSWTDVNCQLGDVTWTKRLTLPVTPAKPEAETTQADSDPPAHAGATQPAPDDPTPPEADDGD